MTHLFLSQNFLILVSKSALSLQPAYSLFPLFSSPTQHSASLQPLIILALVASAESLWYANPYNFAVSFPTVMNIFYLLILVKNELMRSPKLKTFSIAAKSG